MDISIGLIGTGVLFILFALSTPIAFSMIIVAFLGMAACGGWETAFSAVQRVPVSIVGTEGIAVIPLFILMGELAAAAELHRTAYKAAEKWFGNLPGGLAISTSMACAFFGAACGSTVATTSTLGRLATGEMMTRGYSPKLATGSVVAAAGLAALIPPSGLMIIYCLLTDQSVGKMFMAGIIPGLLFMILLMLTTTILVRLKPDLAPRLAGGRLIDKFVAVKEAFPLAFLILMVIGTIYTGVATPSEAGAMGSIGAIVIGYLLRKMSLIKIWQAAINTIGTSCMVLVMIIGGKLLSMFLAYSGLPFVMTDFINDLMLPRALVMAIIILIYLLLGMFLESVGMIMITLPFIWPLILEMGFEPIWFGILLVVLCDIACITPPIGYHLFVMANVRPDVPFENIVRGALPFAISGVTAVTILAAFPQISLWLPSIAF